MTDRTIDSNIVMGNTDVCDILNIKESTLRKYALLLKSGGYSFHVNDKGQRGFFNHDVIVIKKLIEIKGHRDMTLEKAVNAVISWLETSDMAGSVINKKPDNSQYSEDIKELKSTIEQLVQKMDQQQLFLEKQQEIMSQQQEYINNRLEQRDNLLMESLKESQETRKQIATSEEEKKKGFWTKLFGGKD